MGDSDDEIDGDQMLVEQQKEGHEQEDEQEANFSLPLDSSDSTSTSDSKPTIEKSLLPEDEEFEQYYQQHVSRLKSLHSQVEDHGRNQLEKCMSIPLRLNTQERVQLKVLICALNVSEYTDKVDVVHTRGSKMTRIVEEMNTLFSTILGLMTCAKPHVGEDLLDEEEFEANESFFQKIFEIGRRYKVMNPDRMRNTYGKLMYMLQDSQLNACQRHTNMKLVIPIKTVASFLKEKDKL